MGKSSDGFFGVVHGQCHTISLEIVHFVLNYFPIFTFKFDGEFAFSFGYEISGAVLITKSMAANANRGCPVWNQTRNIAAHNWLTENSAIKDVANGAVRALPHLLQIELFHACLVRRNGGTLYSNTILLDGIGGVDGYLVVGLVPVLHAKIIIFYVEVQIRQNQFILDEFPDDAGHLIAIKFYNRIGYFNLLHCYELFVLLRRKGKQSGC